MRKAAILAKRFAILCHRWMGVSFCLLFAWWFVSGIFMMYWDFPSVTAEDRLRHAPAINPATIKLSAVEAYATLKQDEDPVSVRLTSLDSRPVYYFGLSRPTIVYADTGETQGSFSEKFNLRTAVAWTGQPSGSVVTERLAEPDQWTVQGQFRNLWPLLKYSWPDGQQVYVSARNGEVVQYTTRASRIFAHLGPIPHWLYYTPLRKNGPLWSKVVIWLSGLATVAALLGLAVGIMMYSPSKRYRLHGAPASVPYSGQKRLHTILGLFFGIVACTWAFSGMLSMDPFPTERGPGEGVAAIRSALQGVRPPLANWKDPREALALVAPEMRVKELSWVSIFGEPVYLATQDSEHTRIIANGPHDTDQLIQKLRHSVQHSEIAILNDYDIYYRDRSRERPLPVIYIRLDDARYYIDPRTARIVGSYRAGSWVNRWLYHGLHSLDFPWLYNHRPAWDVVVLVLMLGGAALAVTSVIIAVQFLRRKFRNA
jgi:hypothetical protein